MKILKRIYVVMVVMAIIIVAGHVNKANALPTTSIDVLYDSAFGAGQNLFTSGAGVFFDSATGGTGYLAVSAKATDIKIGVVSSPLVSGTIDYRADYISSSDNGVLVTGNFGTDGVFGDDLIIKDVTGTLLTGDFLSMDVKGVIGTSDGLGKASFVVTGGSLMPSIGPSGTIFNLYLAITPSFTATSFDADFTGAVKGDVKVPEPATLLLMGAGLLGLGIFGRKKIKG